VCVPKSVVKVLGMNVFQGQNMVSSEIAQNFDFPQRGTTYGRSIFGVFLTIFFHP